MLFKIVSTMHLKLVFVLFHTGKNLQKNLQTLLQVVLLFGRAALTVEMRLCAYSNLITGVNMLNLEYYDNRHIISDGNTMDIRCDACEIENRIKW